LGFLFPFAGCGGGGGDIAGGPAVGRYVPNYAEEADPATKQPNRLFHWQRFPVRVHFEANSHLTTQRRTQAQAGFAWWAPSLFGEMDLEFVDDPALADINVRFEPKGATGYTGVTQYTYSGSGTLVSADITLNLTYLTNIAYLAPTAAHEFGHALGIGGHSSQDSDLMATAPNVISIFRPTLRDENTMKTAYGSMLAGVGKSPAEPGPLKTAVIVCGAEH
jgi:predicted Zn-dependent protease